MNRLLLAAAVAPLLGLPFTGAPAFAQAFDAGAALRQGEETLRAAPTPPAASPVLPQIVDKPFTMKDKETLPVRRFVVDGVKPEDEAGVAAALAPYEGRKLTLAEIYAAADKVSAYLRTRGYPVAKAYVPAQDARGGSVKLTVLIGKYGAVAVNNSSRLTDDIARGVVTSALEGEETIHRDALERAMLMIAERAGAGMPRIAVGSGAAPGTSDLAFTIPQGKLIDGFLLADNFGTGQTGYNRLNGGIDINSPLGFGDKLSAFGLITERGHLWNGRVAYALPIGYGGLRAELAYFHTTYRLGGSFAALDAHGVADGVSATLAYALLRTRENSVTITANYTYKALNDLSLGVSTADRLIHSGAFGATHEMNTTLFDLPLATSTTLSYTFGVVDYLDATQRLTNVSGVNSAGGYSRANLALNASLGLVDRLSLNLAARGQVAIGRNLDSSEQMGLTGFWGVRSYQEGFAGDTGYLITPELRYQLPEFDGLKHSLGAFTDIGGAALYNASYTVTQKPFTPLYDVGAGYYASYEIAPGYAFQLKAMVARTVGSNAGLSYARGTKALLQGGVAF